MAKKAAESTVIIVPSRRRPPLVVFEHHEMPAGIPVVVLADPDVYEEHRVAYGDRYSVIRGDHGCAAQMHRSYLVGYAMKMDWVFRVDDDMHDRSLVGLPGFENLVDRGSVGKYRTVADAFTRACEAADGLPGVSLVGFSNTTRVDWLSPGFGRTWGLITGNIQLYRSTTEPGRFINPEQAMYEDVWRTCSHREDGGGWTGRVKSIGVDKKTVCNPKTTAYAAGDLAQREEAIRAITTRFPTIVSCDGTRTINGGSLTIAYWKFRPPPGARRGKGQGAQEAPPAS
jgi:hypothetical protein